MDINCTYNCKHQSEGKCAFINNPNSLTMNATNISLSNDTNCPYFLESGV